LDEKAVQSAPNDERPARTVPQAARGIVIITFT
jgi:hypothetical protein